MHLALRPLLLVPLLLTDCGSRQDLTIGTIVLRGEAGTAGPPSAGASAEPTAGASPVAGAGGSPGGVGGNGATGGSELPGAAGMTDNPDESCAAGTEPPVGSLIHRYSFDGSGALAFDTVSAADGNVLGTVLDGSGKVVMNGKSRQYVDLPNGIVSALTDVTVVAWTTWAGEAAYARVFDFGSSNNGEGMGNSGRSYLAVLPKTGFEDQAKPGLGGEVKAPGFPTVTLASAVAIKNRDVQVSLVFRSGVSAALFLDGDLLASQATAITLADIDDRNNWLGQSQYENNPPYTGDYEELRIYDVALDSCQLHTLLVRGPQTP